MSQMYVDICTLMNEKIKYIKYVYIQWVKKI